MKTERELFEKWCFDSGLVTNKMFFELGGQCDEVSSAWEAWQASASREGYKLVPVEPTPKMIDATWDNQEEIESMSHNARNEFIYKSMLNKA